MRIDFELSAVYYDHVRFFGKAFKHPSIDVTAPRAGGAASELEEADGRAMSVDITLAKEEAAPKQDDEVPFFDAILASLSEADRERADADPVDVLIIVRGYKSETPRMEATIEAMRKIIEWRHSVGYYDFFAKSLPGADQFHQWWPEAIHGSDKYGHFLQCLRAAEVDADSLCKVIPIAGPACALRNALLRHSLVACAYCKNLAGRAVRA